MGVSSPRFSESAELLECRPPRGVDVTGKLLTFFPPKRRDRARCASDKVLKSSWMIFVQGFRPPDPLRRFPSRTTDHARRAFAVLVAVILLC